MKKYALLAVATLLFCSATQAQGLQGGITIVPKHPLQKAISFFPDSLNTGNPQVLLDEDFTDGQWNGIGARDEQNNLRWRLTGSTVRWEKPYNRPGVPLAILRHPAEGGASWETAQWNPGGRMYYMNKRDDINVIRWTGYSDLGRRPEVYGVEVAMLEENPDTLFVGPPHFGHDLSWEGYLMFNNDRTQGPVQLEGNVENTNNRQPNGVRRAHWEDNGGYPNDAIFARTFTSTMLWRNNLGQRKCNIEQWGEANYADYYVDTMMTSITDPSNPFAKFNLVQITLFRGGLNTDPPFIKRSTVPNDSLEVGVTYCHVGITKRADFNLDYVVDQQDEAILIARQGRTDTTTIRQGDATNDNKIDLNDALPYVAFLNRSTPTADTVQAQAVYLSSTGTVFLNLRNIRFIKLKSDNGRFNTAASINWGPVAPAITLVSDTVIGAYFSSPITIQNLALGTVLPTGVFPSELSMVINYAGSDSSDGIAVPINASFAVGTKPSLAAQRWLHTGQQALQVPAYGHAVAYRIFSAEGRLLHQGSLPAGQQPASLPATPGTGLRLLQLLHPAGSEVLHSARYMN